MLAGQLALIAAADGDISGAEDALGKRYADGEIDEQEYRARLAVLRETRRR